jgi:integration host factor subunit beta
VAGNKVTKADLIDAIYQRKGINRRDIQILVDALFEEMKSALVHNCSIELRGFGTFEIRVRKGRKKARNPKTGETVSVNSHGVAAFRPGKELKQQVWNLRAVSGDEE